MTFDGEKTVESPLGDFSELPPALRLTTLFAGIRRAFGGHPQDLGRTGTFPSPERNIE
jgi:hypothetical protein